MIANTAAKVQNAAATTAQAGAEAARAAATAESTKETLEQTGMLSKAGSVIGKLGKYLANPYVLAALTLATVTALVIKMGDFSSAWEGLKIGFQEFMRMAKFAISPLVNLFKEWAEGAENIAGIFGEDQRASMINFMNELGAVISLVIYYTSTMLALLLKFMTPMGWILNPEFQGDIKWLVDFLRGDISLGETVIDRAGLNIGGLPVGGYHDPDIGRTLWQQTDG